MLLPAELLGLAASACAAPGGPPGSTTENRSWSQITDQAKGQTVDLWMYGGNQQGNAYVDDELTPAAAEVGVTLRRVPVADTKDAMTRILAERQAGKADGSVDLVWVNGDNSRPADRPMHGVVAGPPSCPTRSSSPPMTPGQPGLRDQVDGCEAPWHKAQFTLVYNSA